MKLNIPKRYKDIKAFVRWVNFDDSKRVRRSEKQVQRLERELAEIKTQLRALEGSPVFDGETDLPRAAPWQVREKELRAQLSAAKAVPLELRSRHRAWVKSILEPIAGFNRLHHAGHPEPQEIEEVRDRTLSQCALHTVLGADTSWLMPARTADGGPERLHFRYLLDSRGMLEKIIRCAWCGKFLIRYQRNGVCCRAKKGRRSDCHGKLEKARKALEREKFDVSCVFHIVDTDSTIVDTHSNQSGKSVHDRVGIAVHDHSERVSTIDWNRYPRCLGIRMSELSPWEIRQAYEKILKKRSVTSSVKPSKSDMVG